jgi:cobalt-precorrin-5B (C1)-methyltransferase
MAKSAQSVKSASDLCLPIGGGLTLCIVAPMTRKPSHELRRGWTTGACATAAVKAALTALWSGVPPQSVVIRLPRGEVPEFAVAYCELGDGFAQVAITKDAGDDPDVTHGALIVARVRVGGLGISFVAGEGVGTVTKPGLPIGVGQAAINPVPRQMMSDHVKEVAAEFGHAPNVEITISVPGGAELAQKTWNPRLGIVGGISILGTTGIVRPFSCSAWIASIHRGVDVARAMNEAHVAGCTGSTSEKAVQSDFNLPDHAMLDMGDFAGGVLKYIAKHPVERVSIGGGIGKLTKLAQGAMDLHSKSSQVDFDQLAEWADIAGLADVRGTNTVLEALSRTGNALAQIVADRAVLRIRRALPDECKTVDAVIVNRDGEIIARSSL